MNQKLRMEAWKISSRRWDRTSGVRSVTYAVRIFRSLCCFLGGGGVNYFYVNVVVVKVGSACCHCGRYDGRAQLLKMKGQSRESSA